MGCLKMPYRPGLWLLVAIALGLCGLWTAPQVHAHADEHERLAALTAQIAMTPQEPLLYLQRAELHRVHQDWAAALADYTQVVQLAPDWLQVAYYRGRMWLEAGRPDLARTDFDQFLAGQPHYAAALLGRSRALARLGEAPAAAADFAQALEYLTAPTPDLYLEYARFLVDQGAEHIDAGLRVIDAGIARLGALVTLIQFAMEVETERDQYGAALARFQELPPALQARPPWLKRRGDLLRAAGRESEAQTVYATALMTLHALPAPRRTVKAMVELEKTLQRLCLSPP